MLDYTHTNLQISAEGIAKRDEKVFRFARARNIPIVMLTSGLLAYMNMYMKFIEYAPFLLCSTLLSCKISKVHLSLLFI